MYQAHKMTDETVPLADFLALEKKKELLDIFFYATAHDLKRPIANIWSLTELMINKTNAEDKEEIAHTIKHAVKGLDGILTGLTDYIRIEHTSGQGAKDIFFTQIISNVKNDFGGLIKELDVKVRVYLEVQTFRYIEAFMISILSNLISNAIKYRSADRNLEIHITTRKEDEFCILTVADNGMGIDLENKSKQLFMPFKRLNHTIEGTGLGLFIIDLMVQKNGGRIEVISTPDMGTSFICYLKEY